MPRVIALALLCVAGVISLSAQTTQGLISGRVLNSVSGQPVAIATVSYSSSTLAATGTYQTDSAGYYFLPLLSAGTYTIHVTAQGYQGQELQQLELAVAGRLQIEFRLRPLSDVWEAGQYRSVFLPGTKTIVTFYGPDVDPSRSGSFEGQQGQRGALDTSVSYVIDPIEIGDLPLQGRDVYTMLVSLPNVTADQGTTRGLGVSVSGQRSSSSDYLLDGVQNNNYLLTGPQNPVAPEAVQEYRISTNNYSAEYGQNAGFIANAVTRAGGNQFHGIGYDYLKNDFLNAADFSDNLSGFGRLPDHEQQFGYQVGGPVRPERLFFSSALEQLISHSKQDPGIFTFPTTNFIPALNLPSDRLARQLLQEFPGPVITSQNITAPLTISPPVVVDRLIALERGDYVLRGGRDHLMGRLAIGRTTEPDFIWTPYTEFNSALHQHTTGGATNWLHTWAPRLSSELKLSYTDDNLWWNRAHPEIPTLISLDNTLLPGSPAFYEYRNHNRTGEIIYSTIWTRNRHIITAGSDILFRFDGGDLTAGRDGEYIFPNIISFAFDQPEFFRASIDRLASTPTQPDFNRAYGYNQSSFFVQDSYRVTPRLTLNYGLRYENFGAPENTGAIKDALVVPGPGSNFTSRLASATLQIPSGAGNERLFGADNRDWAPRFGFSWDPLGKGNTVVRGGFGIFYDRPFDNLWQNLRNNGILLPLYTISGASNYLQPIASVLSQYAIQSSASDFPSLTLMDPNLRNGYAETFFVGVQQSFGSNLIVEINGTGSVDHRLITTDIVNRQFTTSFGDGRPNDNFPNISWRSSQGNADYSALSAFVRYRLRTLQLQAAYTWSHSIDNQSDPLVGDFFALDFTAINSASSNQLTSSFATQYNSAGDRGNSDFDQRQNLFLIGIWQSEGRTWFARGWQIASMAAFRSGFPYTILSPSEVFAPGSGIIENQRGDLINPTTAVYSSPQQAPGGLILLNPAAFSIPLNGAGNIGRNAFRGPGLYNFDFSLARSFAIPHLREGTRLVIRADAFNLLNHANLNNPDSLVGSPTFGLATYGRLGAASGFPAVSPVNETARQIQILLRLEF